MGGDLVLVHGFWSSPSTWDKLEKYWADKDDLPGLRIHKFGYESPKLSFPFSTTRIPDYNDIARSLPGFLTASVPPDRPLAMVTHSQGGLIVQNFLAWMLSEGRGEELARIRLIIMLACPNEGSEYLRSIRAMAGFGRHPQAGQLKVLSREVGDARRVVMRQIVHAKTVDATHCPIPIYVYSGRTDKIVPLQSAQSVFPNAEVLPGNHFTIIDPNSTGNITGKIIAARIEPIFTHAVASFTLSKTEKAHISISPINDRVTYLYGLPPDISNFTGRHEETREIDAAFTQRDTTSLQVVALFGKPGVGKSALAIHMAHKMTHSFPDGQLYANLRGQDGEPIDPMEVLTGFLLALGVHQDYLAPLNNRDAQYRSLLNKKRLLIVLDNANGEWQVRPLIPSGRHCGVIVTSRVVLASLDAAYELDLELIGHDEGVALLAAISGRVISSDRHAAEEIVRLCGRLPLAIRIAGGILRKRPHWSFARLNLELTDERTRIQRLEVGDLAIDSCFFLSLKDLDGTDIRLFRLLANLPFPWFTAESASRVLQLDRPTIVSGLENLVGAQLLETRDGDRFQFHDLVRLYASQLPTAPNDDAVVSTLRVLAEVTSEFERSYLPTLRAALSGIRIFDNSRDLRPTLDSVYVEQILLPLGMVDQTSVTWSQTLSRHNRIVILGNPGVGKTTFIQHIALIVASARAPNDPAQFVPLLMPLRDLIQFGDGADFTSGTPLIRLQLRTRYQVEVTDDSINMLLHSGRALLIFDGLDEIIDPVRRRQIVELIEHLSAQYSDAKIIVTSRIIGYELVPLDPHVYSSFLLQPLKDAQIEDFVKKWFRESGSASETDSLARSFIEESSWLGSVRSSPLLLGQLAMIYRDRGSLPRNISDIYERVLLRTWDRWDAARGIDAGQGSQFADSMLSELAFEVLDREGAISDFTRAEIATAVKMIADRRGFPNPQRFAEDFLNSVTERSQILVNSGVAASGEMLFSFEHRGVCEFLAARHLIRTRDLAEMTTWLIDHLQRTPSSQVLPMAVSMYDQIHGNGGDELLESVLSRSEAGGLPTLVGREAIEDMIRSGYVSKGFRR